MSDDRHVDELIAWYALDALGAEERAAVERHLATCAQCRAQAAEVAGVAGLLAQASDPVTPSPRIKRDLMARLDAERAGTHEHTSLSARLRGWWAGATGIRALALAGAALLLLLGGWNLLLQDELSRTRAQLDLALNPAARVAALPATANAPRDAQARLFLASDSNSALLAVTGLKPLGANQTYQFWLIRRGQPEPAGCFNVDQSGSARVAVRSTQPVGNFDQAGITVEGGCMPSPTLSALVFVGSIQ